MMRAKSALCAVAAALAATGLLAGCSASKQYFSPEVSEKFVQKSIARAAADEFGLRGDGQFAYKSSPQGRLEISPLATGGAEMGDKPGTLARTYDLSAQVLSIAVQGNLAAIIDAKNTAILYDLAEQSTLFSQNFGPSFGVVLPLAAPRFSDNLALIPTLDGKIAVISVPQRRLVRTINVGLNEQFNNLIFLKTSDESMLAVSASKAITIAQSRPHTLVKSFKTAAADEQNAYLFTSAGEVLRTDYALQTLASAHFEYANFLAATLHGGYLYALELSGKLLKLDAQDLSVVKIYDFGEKITKYSGFSGENMIINLKIYPLP